MKNEQSINAKLTARQRLLLALLNALGGSARNLDFQKVLFLYCQEPDAGKPYDFVPYKRGAFSFTSYADRRKLISYGLIEDSEHHWKLTDAAGATESDIFLKGFVESLDGLQGDELIADTYRRFPYYAIRSEIAEEVLNGDDAALARIEEEKSRTSPYPLQTIGYEGRSLESYLNLLIQAGVNVLCDVRRNPISRKYGFSKSTLANACAGVGIWYEHLPELGIASDQRQALNSHEDYDALFAKYERDHLPTQDEALTRIQEWIENGARVALTCYEHLPNQCHRHCVAKKLEAMSQSRLEARHL
ncbi:MAG TPA: DUF488 domain-containing protein [Fimbriimonadaceae bacterium]|nr:DUF488 domain-containing protein [Fimbriimonadaceae bacterium]